MPTLITNKFQGFTTCAFDSKKLSIEEFQLLAYDHLARINTTQPVLHEIYAFLKEMETIKPIQCVESVSKLETLRLLLQEFRKILEQHAVLSMSITPYRYQLLAQLDESFDQIDKLIIRLDDFSLNCLTLSGRARSQRREITDKLEALIDNIGAFPQQIQVLLDRARFQERNLGTRTGNGD